MVKSRQRSRRKDPDQEAILQVKDEINERMSKLIELLKDVKSGMNGGPAPEVGVSEKVSLTQPLPDSVPSAGNAAVQELSAISQGISHVKQMQDAYAEKRDQRLADRSKKMNEIQQQVIEAAVEEELRKTASNALTRAWSHIVAPFSSEQGRWERLSLLRSLARLDDNLTEVENEVLSSDPSILNALHLAKQLYIDAKSTFFGVFRKQLNSMIDSTSDELNKLKKNIGEAGKKGLFEFIQESPLKDGPVQMPNEVPAPTPRNVLEKLDKAVSTAETAVKDSQIAVEKVQEQEKELSDKPVKMPDIPDSVPSIPKWEQKSEAPEIDVQTEKPETEKPETPAIHTTEEELHEEVLNPPPESPLINPIEIRKVVRAFIWKNAHDMYSAAHAELSKLPNIPEPWKSRLANIWQSITVPLQAIRTKPEVDRMITAYMHLVKGIGDLNANIYVFGNEIKESEIKPDFIFGSTINDQQLNSQSLQFVQSHWNELQSIIPQQGLVSEGSDKLTRWLNRIKTHLSFGPDKNLRLITAKNIRDSRDRLQTMLNTLEERNINFRSLIAQSNDFYESFISMYDMLADLAESYNSRMMIEKSKQKYEKGRMKYDLIRETDIRGIRNIANILRTDMMSIKSLENLEESYLEISKEIDQIKEQHG